MEQIYLDFVVLTELLQMVPKHIIYLCNTCACVEITGLVVQNIESYSVACKFLTLVVAFQVLGSLKAHKKLITLNIHFPEPTAGFQPPRQYCTYT